MGGVVVSGEGLREFGDFFWEVERFSDSDVFDAVKVAVNCGKAFWEVETEKVFES